MSDVEWVAPGTLRPWEPQTVWPPSWRGTPAWRELEASIRRERAVWHPLYVLADGTVVDGLARLEIARALGLDAVPVRRVLVPLPLTPSAKAAIEAEAVARALARRQLSAEQVQQLALRLAELAKARPLSGTAPAAAPTREGPHGSDRDVAAPERRAPALTVVPGGRARREAPDGAVEPRAEARAAAPARPAPALGVAQTWIDEFGQAEDALVDQALGRPDWVAPVRLALLDAEREWHELSQRLAARWAQAAAARG